MDPSNRGTGGPMDSVYPLPGSIVDFFFDVRVVGFFGNFSKVSQNFMEACKELGIQSIPDINTSAGCLGAAKVIASALLNNSLQQGILTVLLFDRSVSTVSDGNGLVPYRSTTHSDIHRFQGTTCFN